MNKSLSSQSGRVAVMILCVAGVAAIGWVIWSRLAPDKAVSAVNDPEFVNFETGYIFHQSVSAGMTYPVKCPDTGKFTGYQPELCYWAKDGSVKKDPTRVVLNSDRGLPEPTFCQDCGKRVIHHNPKAAEGHHPPPTEAEYAATHAQN